MKILVAHDEAFNFIYKANIDSLRALGDVSFFSPLRDTALPQCDLLYLPGGYPELHLEAIAANRAMAESIRDYAESGGKLFAECGGFMYLCNDIDGTPMCGVLPFKATMANARLHLGYRQMVWGCEKRTLHGHEFHYSDVIDAPHAGIQKLCNQYSAKGKKTETAIYLYKNVIAGYTHWYWAEHGFPFL